jgi:DNA-binding transcriptional LysR family regulator
MKINWDDMRTVLALVRAGTLAGAADDLEISYTTVARRVRRAEEMLGRPLFERHPDGYVPTRDAEEMAGAAGRMEAEEHNLLREMTGRDDRLEGPLTLTAPQLLIQEVLAPLLAEFVQRHPEVQLTVRASNDILDLTRREADLAIRISRSPGDSLVGQRLTEQSSAFFAAPGVARRALENPSDPLGLVLYDKHGGIPETLRKFHPDVRIKARFDDMTALASAAKAGMGVLRMPLFLGRSMPGLVPLSHIPLQPYAPVWMLTHQDLKQAARVSAMKAVIEPWIRANRSLFTELDAQASTDAAIPEQS